VEDDELRRGSTLAGVVPQGRVSDAPYPGLSGGARTNIRGGGAICQWKPYVLRSSRN
jgi:hypothetical protein